MAKKKIKKSIKESVKTVPSRPKFFTAKKIKIRVIGLGGGGSSIVSELASRMSKISFVVANTDLQALKTSSKKAIHFKFGERITRGLGTGMNPDLGREIALEEKERIQKLLEGYDFCIIVGCLGGGTGSGAAPVFAKISQELGNITYGIFTLPFNFEGERKMEIAKEALGKLRSKLDIYSIIPNERIFNIIDKKTPLKEALSIINNNLSQSLEGLIEMVYTSGLINIDFADFKTIISGLNNKGKKTMGQLAYLNTHSINRNKGTVKNLIEGVLNNPLYPYSVSGAKGVLLNIAGEKDLSLTEVNSISKTISDLVHPEAKIIFGISQKKKYSGVIKTTVLAAGCSAKIFSSKIKSKPKKKRVESKKIEVEEKPKEEPKEELKEKMIKLKKKKIKKIVQKPSVKKVVKKIVKEKKIEKKVMPPRPKIDMKKRAIALKALQEEMDSKIRKNALQIKKETEEEEREMLEQEKIWETPAFLRKNPIQDK
ncbi:MAG: cell division protein FtsZ [Patescibacteria group bacterium]